MFGVVVIVNLVVIAGIAVFVDSVALVDVVVLARLQRECSSLVFT